MPDNKTLIPDAPRRRHIANTLSAAGVADRLVEHADQRRQQAGTSGLNLDLSSGGPSVLASWRA